MNSPIEAGIVCGDLCAEYEKAGMRSDGQLLRGVVYFLRTYYGDRDIVAMVKRQEREDREDAKDFPRSV